MLNMKTLTGLIGRVERKNRKLRGLYEFSLKAFVIALLYYHESNKLSAVTVLQKQVFFFV